jgi:NAD(P)-dependent dehydrogenase (short-subunit alcohol dehydrogenase family)
MNLTDDDLPGLEKMLALPAGRLGTPDDLGAAALFLVSDAAQWITGQVIKVTGGP